MRIKLAAPRQFRYEIGIDNPKGQIEQQFQQLDQPRARYVAPGLKQTRSNDSVTGGLATPIIAYFATARNLDYAIPIMGGTMIFATGYIVALIVVLETKDKPLVADLVMAT